MVPRYLRGERRVSSKADSRYQRSEASSEEINGKRMKKMGDEENGRRMKSGRKNENSSRKLERERTIPLTTQNNTRLRVLSCSLYPLPFIRIHKSHPRFLFLLWLGKQNFLKEKDNEGRVV